MSLMSYDEAREISIKKKFIFNIDITQLTTNDLQYIAQNSHNTVNIIDETYRKKIEFQLKERVDQNKETTNNFSDNMVCHVGKDKGTSEGESSLNELSSNKREEDLFMEKQRTCVIDIGNLLNDDDWLKPTEDVEPRSTASGDQSSVLAIEDYNPTKSTISALLDSFKTERVSLPERDDKSEKLNQRYSVHTLLALLNQRQYPMLDNVDTSGNTLLKNDSSDLNLGVEVKVKEEDVLNYSTFLAPHRGVEGSRDMFAAGGSLSSVSHEHIEEEKEGSTSKQYHIEESEDGSKQHQKSPIQIENEKFREKFFNKEMNRYVCNDCGSSYTSKQNFLIHLNNKSRCKNMRIQQSAMKAEEENSLANFVRQEKFQHDGKVYVVQNIGCVNNIQNICNNVQNITNNSNSVANQNTMNLSLRDFISEDFDISHLNKEITEKNDFFLYPNFLKAIMENETNHNIFFTEKEAIVFSDNELNRMSSDKAGYIVMDKLSKSCSELIDKQDEETQKKLDHVGNYYRVSKGQFVNDTTYREYSVEKKAFCHTASENLFRNRDKIHNKIISTLRPYNQIVRGKLMKSGYNIHDIPLFDPKIEYYISVRCRYKE
jgi:hypothetical protein